jgi:hypothetical protein
MRKLTDPVYGWIHSGGCGSGQSREAHQTTLT